MSKIVTKSLLPFDFEDNRTITADCFPMQLVPIVAKMLLRRTYSTAFDDGDTGAGKDAILRCIMSIYEGCKGSTSEAINNVYRLLDTALYGRQYTTNQQSGGALIVIPAIPAVPNTAAQLPGLVARAQRLEHLIDNAINGTFYTGEYESHTSMRNQLQDIIALLSTTPGDNSIIIARLTAILQELQ